MNLPSRLSWLKASPRGRAWLANLPATLALLAEQWELDVDTAFDDSYISLVLPARRAGLDLVLKIQYPDRESAGEAAALRIWQGNGAIRLVDEDTSHHALLLERCFPGHHLSTAEPSVWLNVITGLLPRLWVPVDRGIASLTDEVTRWVVNLPGEFTAAGSPFEPSLLDAAMEALVDLATSQGEEVLIHQDLHADNVLSAQREPWLVIDPKPLIGEREFGLSPIIRSAELGHSRQEVMHRLDRLSDDLGLDRERSRLWAFGQAIAWGFESGKVLPGHIETARWLLDG